MSRALSLAAALALTASAHADLLDVRFERIPFGPPGTLTCRAIATFSRPDDALLAISGSAADPLAWSTVAASGIINDDAANVGTINVDLPHGLNGSHDTWFTMGPMGGGGPFADFPPVFPGCWVPGDPMLPDGCTGFVNTDTGYFWAGPPVPVSTYDPGGNAATGWDVPFAQFTVSDDGWADPMGYEGQITYATVGTTVTTTFDAGVCRDPCPSDANGDFIVDFADLLVVLTDWGCTSPPGPCPGDINGDGTVDFGDVLQVLSSWGHCFPT